MTSLLDRPSTWSSQRPGRVMRIGTEADPALAAALREDGMELRTAASGRDALDALSWAPDVIVVPVTLEDMDATEFLGALTRHPLGKLVASVVQVPAGTDEASLVTLLEAGADDVFSGPCTSPVFRARILRRVDGARRRQAMQRDSMRDPLTRVFSRGFFLANLRMRVSRLLRQLSDRLCLILIDVDDPSVSDGAAPNPDEVLRRVASVLDLACREGDLVARYGGRTFVLTLSGATQTQGAVVADRLRRTIEEEELDGENMTVSCGVAAWENQRAGEGSGEDVDPQGMIEALLRGADAALEDAKRRGPNRVSSNAWADPAFAALSTGGSSVMN